MLAGRRYRSDDWKNGRTSQNFIASLSWRINSNWGLYFIVEIRSTFNLLGTVIHHILHLTILFDGVDLGRDSLYIQYFLSCCFIVFTIHFNERSWDLCSESNGGTESWNKIELLNLSKNKAIIFCFHFTCIETKTSFNSWLRIEQVLDDKLKSRNSKSEIYDFLLLLFQKAFDTERREMIENHKKRWESLMLKRRDMEVSY